MTVLKLHDMKITRQTNGCETDGAEVELINWRLMPSTMFSSVLYGINKYSSLFTEMVERNIIA